MFTESSMLFFVLWAYQAFDDLEYSVGVVLQAIRTKASLQVCMMISDCAIQVNFITREAIIVCNFLYCVMFQ